MTCLAVEKHTPANIPDLWPLFIRVRAYTSWNEAGEDYVRFIPWSTVRNLLSDDIAGKRIINGGLLNTDGQRLDFHNRSSVWNLWLWSREEGRKEERSEFTLESGGSQCVHMAQHAASFQGCAHTYSNKCLKHLATNATDKQKSYRLELVSNPKGGLLND